MGCCCSAMGCCCLSAETKSPLLEDGDHKGSVQRGGGDVAETVDLNMDFGGLKGVHHLCNGGMCSIYTAQHRSQPVVIKIPRDDCAQPDVARKDLETEADLLSRLSHAHIIRLLGAGSLSPMDVDGDGREAGDFKDLDQPPKRFLMLEFLAGGTLTDQMGVASAPTEGVVGTVVRRWQQQWQFPMKRALDCGLQLASALHYMHEEAVEGHFVVHRDIKPENLGFTIDGSLKLFDFGLAKLVKRRSGRLNQRYEMTGETGSTRYMSPEVALQLPYNEKTDCYSFGLILWEMLSLMRPFEGLGKKEFTQSVIRGGKRPDLRPEWSEDLKRLLRRCWDQDIDSRPSFKEVERTLRDLVHSDAGMGWGSLASPRTRTISSDGGSPPPEPAGPDGDQQPKATRRHRSKELQASVLIIPPSSDRNFV